MKFHKVEVISFLQSFIFLCYVDKVEVISFLQSFLFLFYVNKVEVISFLQLFDHSKVWRNEITSTLLTKLIKWKGNYFRNFSLVFFNMLSGMIIVYKSSTYRTRANKWRSRSVAAPLRIHAKSNFLLHFYVTIWGVKQ